MNELIKEAIRRLIDKQAITEEETGPLVAWFDEFENELKKNKVEWKTAKMDPVKVVQMYYKKYTPKKASQEMLKKYGKTKSVKENTLHSEGNTIKENTMTNSNSGMFNSHGLDASLLSAARNICNESDQSRVLPTEFNAYLNEGKKEIYKKSMMPGTEISTYAYRLLEKAQKETGVTLSEAQRKTFISALGG